MAVGVDVLLGIIVRVGVRVDVTVGVRVFVSVEVDVSVGMGVGVVGRHPNRAKARIRSMRNMFSPNERGWRYTVQPPYSWLCF